MKKSLVIIGCFALVVLLVGAVFPSVAGYQVNKNLMSNNLDEIEKEIEEAKNTFLNDNGWQPGVFILLFYAVMQAVMQEIAEGNYVPGMVFGALILYLGLVWLILFGQNIDTSS